jgi:hypothetical protein
MEPLARYCELRERGLRREAFAALQGFLGSTAALEPGAQRQLVLRVLAAHARAPEAHQFLSQPLLAGLVEPVLRAWCAEQPSDPVPAAALGLLLGERELLERALALEPADDRVRARLVSQLLGEVDFATHHLSESSFIGEPAAAAAVLEAAESLMQGAADAAHFDALRSELAELRRLLRDWAEYSACPEGSFPDWCRARGRAHRWWTAYCYELPTRKRT